MFRVAKSPRGLGFGEHDRILTSASLTPARILYSDTPFEHYLNNIYSEMHSLESC